MRKEIFGIPAWLYAAAFLPRLLILAAAASNPAYCVTPDSAGYLDLAASLAGSGAFGLPGPGGAVAVETFRTPGYPLFLAVLGFLPGSLVLNAAIAQALIGGVTVLFAWKWFRELAGGRGAALGALLLALDYVSLMHTPQVLADTLQVPLLLLAAASTWKAVKGGPAGTAAGAGLSWSVASFLKPVTLYLPLLLAAFFWRRKKHMALFLLLAYALPLAWSARNYARTGYFTYSSIGGVVLLKYSAGSVEALRTGRPFSETSRELLAGAEADYPSDAARSAAYSARAMEILREYPGLTLRYLLHDLLVTVGGTGTEMLPQLLGLPVPQAAPGGGAGAGTRALLGAYPLLWGLQAGYMLLLAACYLLFAAGLRRLALSGRRAAAIFLLVPTLYLFGMASTNGYYRYRIPVMIFLAAGIAAAFAERKKGEV